MTVKLTFRPTQVVDLHPSRILQQKQLARPSLLGLLANLGFTPLGTRTTVEALLTAELRVLVP